MMSPPLPSIRRRLARALLAWSVAGSAAVAAAVWLQADHEVDELLDETLQASAQALAPLMGASPALPSPDTAPRATPGGADSHFAWQLLEADGRLLARSAQAPTQPLQSPPHAGLGTTARWRVFGQPLGDGRLLVVAHERDERGEAKVEVALSAVLAALAVALLGHVWLRAAVDRELQPLQRLSDRLATLDPAQAADTLGPAERQELQPVHSALGALARRLSRRLAHERALAAHAAHALRTPLAAIDAQLAVALREAPPERRPRLQRARDAASRLQRVVAALLALFRSGAALRRQPVDLAALLADLPLPDLQVDVPPGRAVQADPDLLVAALINLLDNAARAGARRVRLSTPQPGLLRVEDDGAGLDPDRRLALQRQLDREDLDEDPGEAEPASAGSSAGRPGMGLGLRLAGLVARAHGGRVQLHDGRPGAVIDLWLAPSSPGSPRGEAEAAGAGDPPGNAGFADRQQGGPLDRTAREA